MAKIIEDVCLRGTILSRYMESPFDDGKAALEKQGYRIISLEENAGLRILLKENSFISRNGNYTREAIIGIPKKGIYLVKSSPIMKKPEEATLAHRMNREFKIYNWEAEQALANSIKLSKDPMLTIRLQDDPAANFAFGVFTQRYGEFLWSNGIKEINVNVEDLEQICEEESKPIVRPVVFMGLTGNDKSKSAIQGKGRVLNFDHIVRGYAFKPAR